MDFFVDGFFFSYAKLLLPSFFHLVFASFTFRNGLFFLVYLNNAKHIFVFDRTSKWWRVYQIVLYPCPDHQFNLQWRFVAQQEDVMKLSETKKYKVRGSDGKHMSIVQFLLFSQEKWPIG